MDINQFLNKIVFEYGKNFESNSEIFNLDFYHLNAECSNDFPNFLKGSQRFFVPVRSNCKEKSELFRTPNFYCQLENGLYVSSNLFKYLGFLETSNRRKEFSVIF